MIYTYNIATQTVASGDAVTFAVNGVQTGCTATHIPGSTTISLNRPGYYYITAVAEITSATAGTDVELGLYGNGELIQGTNTIVTIAAADAVATIPINTIVRVVPNCCSAPDNVPFAITVVNTSANNETISNITLTITKVG